MWACQHTSLCQHIWLLERFAGSAIIVSHDRYFLRRVATRIITIEDGDVSDYNGDYDVRRILSGGLHTEMQFQ